jgi:cystathionine beta-lyase
VASVGSVDDLSEPATACLAANRRLVADHLPPEIHHHSPEATYLAWLDCRGADLGPDPVPFFKHRAKVLLFSGPAFGPGGEGFARLNFATDPGVLTEVLGRMRTAIATR